MKQHNFSADRPISTVDEDLLNRSDFAESLATAISSWKGKDSLVIALHGDWGSGKTSLKNMVVATSKNQKLESPYLLEFNPWEWASQDQISKSFFDHLGLVLGKEDKKKIFSAIAKKFRLYGQYLDAGSTIVTGLAAALPVFFGLALLLIFGFAVFDDPWVKGFLTTIGISLGAWAGILKWGKKFMGKIYGVANEHANQYEYKLSELKESITKDMRNLGKPLLVIIDDIDRLTPEETQTMFQLVKANADFPNIVYLLLFQRDIVEQKLNGDLQLGRDYLEKIVQVPFDIPKVEQSCLDNILFSNIDRILEEDELISKRFNQLRWGNIFYGGMHDYFKTLRNIYRYSSTLSFYVSLLKGNKAFEVNPVDLIAIECLRCFEPDVYKAISTSKMQLTSTFRDAELVKLQKVEIANIVSKATNGRESQVKEILKQLFPQIEYCFGGHRYGSDFSDTWFKELRVCYPEIFPRYFQFSIPEGEISQSDLDVIISLSSNRSGLVEKLTSFDSEHLKNALSQLDSYKQDIPLENSDSFVTALMDIGDTTSAESIGFTGLGAHMHLSRIVLWYLRQENSVEDRGAKLLSAFSKTEGLSVMAHLLAGEDSRRENPDKADLLLTTDTIFEQTKNIFVEKISTLANENPTELLSNIHLPRLLYRWGEWGSLERVRTWIEAEIRNFDDLMIFLNGFCSRSTSQGDGDYVVSVKRTIRLEDIDNFYSSEKVSQLISGMDKNNLSNNNKDIVEAFKNAYESNAELDNGSLS